MSKEITLINKNKTDDYNVIVEDEKGDKVLTKYSEDLEQLLKQNIFVKNINEEITNVSKDIKSSNEKPKLIIRDIITDSFLLPALTILGAKIIIDWLYGKDCMAYIPNLNKEVVLANFYSQICAIIAVPAGAINFIYNIFKHKKVKKKQISLNAQYEYLVDTYEKETEKLEELKQKVNLENNSVQLEPKKIDAKEELEKLKEELLFYYNQGYYNGNTHDENNLEINNVKEKTL